MEKVIDGKIYNTETAEEVGSKEFSNGGDFEHYFESVSRTKKGNWFVYKTGGAMSRMAVSCGNNNTCGSSEIYAISENEAFEKLEKMNAINGIKKYFSKKLQEA